MADQTVLIVEDRPALQRYLDEILKQWGVFTAVAADLPDAIERVNELRSDPGAYALLIVDVMIPAISRFSDDPLPLDFKQRSHDAGFELIRTLRALPAPTCDLPVVVFTARQDDAVKATARGLRCDFFLKDPDSGEIRKFRARLRELLGLPPESAAP